VVQVALLSLHGYASLATGHWTPVATFVVHVPLAQ